ncbi:hypothetical protein SprV_0802476800 [Sparganum proliferum]
MSSLCRLLIIVSLLSIEFTLSNKVSENEDEVREKLEILPTFNQGMKSQLYDPRNKRLMAKVHSAHVIYTKQEVHVRIQYEVHLTEFYTDCYLNGSEAMARFSTYNLQMRRRSGEYEADIHIKRLQEFGIVMLSFQLSARSLTDELMVQYSVNLQDRENRAVTRQCPSLFSLFPKINTLLIQLWIDDYAPMGINWEQIVVMKRIHVRATGVSLIHLPLFVVTRTPFTVKFLTLWSFQNMVAFFSANGLLRLESSTMSTVGTQESGGYTIRWFIPENQHVIDEFCADQLPRLPVRAGAPLFFYVDPEQQDRWSFDLEKLSRLVSKRKSLSLYVACVMGDVFQDLPKKKNFVVVVKKRMFYSDGDDLGFLSYVYKVNLTSPTLKNFDCITRTTKKVPFIPLTRTDEAGVYPPIAGTPLATRLVLTLTFACNKLDRQIKINEVYLKGPLPATTRTDIQVGKGEMWSVCKVPRKNFEFILPGWKKDDVYTITASLSPGNIVMSKAVILGPYDQLTVQPTVAFADQTVEIMCFQDLLKKLSAPNKRFATMFAPSAVEYLLLEGLNQTDYLTLLSFTPKERYVLQTANIDSSVVIVNVNDTSSAYIHLHALARHLTKFSGFRCRLKMKNVFNQEYSVINREPVCFALRPSRIRIAIDGVFLPKVSNEVVNDITRVQKYQLSCVRPGQDLEISCMQSSVLVECAHCPRMEAHFDVAISVLAELTMLNTTREFEPIIDSSGRANVPLKKLTTNWHRALVVCRQTLYTKRTTLEEKKSVVNVQFSATAKLCISGLTFTFYKLYDGFSWEKGLLTTVERAKRLAKSELLSTDKMHDLLEVSAILCEVDKNYAVHDMKMHVQSGVQNFNASFFGMQNTSLLVLPKFTPDLLNQPIKVTCTATRTLSGIPAVSEPLRFVVVQRTFQKGSQYSEFILLMQMVCTSLLIGFLIAIACPLFSMIADQRYERRQLEKRREKQKAIESLLNLKLEVEKEAGPGTGTKADAEAKTTAAVRGARGGGGGGGGVGVGEADAGVDEGTTPRRPVDRRVRSARQSLAILNDLMRARAMKRASQYSMPLGDSFFRGRSAGTSSKDADASEGPETSEGGGKTRRAEMKKRTQSAARSASDSRTQTHKKSKSATPRSTTLRVTRPTHKGTFD